MNWRAVVVVFSVGLAGCASSSGSTSGSLIGAFAGSPGDKDQPVAASIVEAMAGGLIGQSIGEDLDRSERRRALEAEYRALEYTPSGQRVTWGKTGSRQYGEVVAGSPYRVGSQDCRQYTHTVYTRGVSQSARGAACRNVDGSWTPLV
ncbi:hypothetical protein [Aquamicrobium sp. LC103]|uniref:hypothetical protein n=1 Tax=Aquamicrobium sp. LC103 TaxID=1120658 RepID=UPI00063E7910|nr:hypothetical protein [Aquamicrobium sp. LC103]TKT81242.1 hypothetical protein XW59_005070 [Aquamicrobium sp. LC103]